MNQTKIHISERFFTKAKRYFGSLQSALSEALQNAYRATLPRLRGGELCVIQTIWNPELKSLTIRDHGIGIQDIGAALSIGISSWGKGVEEEQDPAGMGLCGVMAYCDRLIFISSFGSLTVDTKKFFEEPSYRETLLERIDTSKTKEGTCLIMMGVHIKDDSEIHQALDAAAKFHTAIRIEYNEDHGPGKPEGPVERIKNFLEIGAWKEREETYRGYKVYERSESYSNCYSYCNRDTLNLVWHGHLIKVPLASVQVKVRLPELPEPISTTLEIPGLDPRSVVIDYGVAPVTPKLPDRDAVIMDDKTVEFISGLYMPELTARIEKVRAALIQAACVLKTGTFDKRQDVIYDIVPGGGYRYGNSDHKRTCRQLQPQLYVALFNHYIGQAVVTTLAPEDLGQGRDDAKLVKDLVPFDALPTVYCGGVLLWSTRSKTGRLLRGDNEKPNQFLIKEHDLLAVRDWDPEAHPGTELIGDHEVIAGLVHEIEQAVGDWPKELEDIKFTKGLVVVHIDKTAKELGWPVKEHFWRAEVIRTEGPVKLSVLKFQDGSELQGWVDTTTERDYIRADDLVCEISMGDLLQGLPTFEVPSVMCRFNDDMEPTNSVFVGPEKEIFSLISRACDYESYGPSRSDEMSNDEWQRYVIEEWDTFRSKISGVPELDTEITALIDKIRARAQLEGDRSRIVSLGINVDKNTLTFRCTDGKTTKTKYR